MKKKNKNLFLIPSALLLSLFILAGCANKDTQNNQTNQNSQTGNQSGNNNLSRTGRRMPDFGQPKREADIRGVVKSIVGNQVTILKMDMPAGGRRASSTPDGTSSTTKAAVSLSGTSGSGRQGGFMMGGQGGPGGPGGDRSTTDRATMMAELKKLSTGEETITVPIGIQMLKSSVNSGTNKREMVEATLEDISADKMVTVWLNAGITDKKVAEFILIN